MKIFVGKCVKCLKSNKEVFSEKSKFRVERFCLETNGLMIPESNAMILQLLNEHIK